MDQSDLKILEEIIIEMKKRNFQKMIVLYGEHIVWKVLMNDL
jgi:hypothetical protein